MSRLTSAPLLAPSLFRGLSAFLALAAAVPAQQEPRPNVVLCMADDQGWGDVGYRGHKQLKTPILDDMARKGLRFDRFYAAAPVCSPTRGSVLTGRHPNRFGCFQWGHTLRPQEDTLAEALRRAGYTTGHFGKWHLGSVRAGSPVSPGGSGFDEWVSSPNFYENNPLMSHNGVVVETEGESSRVTVDAALRFIRGAVEAKKPFLAVVWFGNPHTPHVATAKMKKPYEGIPKRRRNYYGEVTGIDRAMGHLREQLRDLGVADDTVLWYTSDNGSKKPGSTGGLRGQKGELWEGGIRVPAILEWPARIRSPRVSSIPCSTVDIYPTVLAMCGVKEPAPHRLDGIDLAPVISGETPVRNGPLAFWDYPARGKPVYSQRLLRALAAEQQNGQQKKGQQKKGQKKKVQKKKSGKGPADVEDGSAGAITEKYSDSDLPGHAAWMAGAYKLHRIPLEPGGFRYELYDLQSDPLEKRDLAVDQEQRVGRMKVALERWQKSVIRSLNGEDYGAAPKKAGGKRAGKKGKGRKRRKKKR